MLKNFTDLSSALIGGVVLAVMIFINSTLGKNTSPLFASWTAHGIGTLGSLGLIFFFHTSKKNSSPPTPVWAYCGGITGAMTVLLAAITVNSPLGLFGSLILMISGQIVLGIFLDRFGLLGAKKRNLTAADFTISILILLGCILIMKGHP